MSFGGAGPAPTATSNAQQKPKEAPKVEEPAVEEEAADLDLGDMFG